MSNVLPLRIDEAFSVRGKVVLLTGAVGTIGRSVAHVFAANGARLICSDRDVAELEGLARECETLGSAPLVRTADLQSPDELRALLDFVDQQHGRVDVIIHCGAIAGSLPAEQEQDDHFDLMFHTNVQSMWILAKYSIPLFQKAGGGSFITFSSINGHRPCLSAPFYVGTKAAVMNMSRELAAEFLHLNIRFNTVSPGSTGQQQKHLHALAESMNEPFASEIVARMHELKKERTINMDADPTEVAHSLIFLASAAGRRLNGADIVIDGGHLVLTDWQYMKMGKQYETLWDKLCTDLKKLPPEAWKEGPPKWLR